MALLAISGQPLRRQVAFVGPFGVGKSTAVTTISDTPVVRAESGPSAPVGASRRERSQADALGADYGEWNGGVGGPVAVIAAPGQARFGTTLRSELVRASRVVLWLFGQTPYALDEAEEWLEYISPDIEDTPLAVAVTRLEIPGDRPALEDYRAVVDRWARGAPIVSADPRDRASVEEVVRAALKAQVGARLVRR